MGELDEERQRMKAEIRARTPYMVTVRLAANVRAWEDRARVFRCVLEAWRRGTTAARIGPTPWRHVAVMGRWADRWSPLLSEDGRPVVWPFCTATRAEAFAVDLRILLADVGGLVVEVERRVPF